jgi:hypothetical protein
MYPSRGIYASRLLAFRTPILGAVQICIGDMTMPRRMATVLPALQPLRALPLLLLLQCRNGLPVPLRQHLRARLRFRTEQRQRDNLRAAMAVGDSLVGQTIPSVAPTKALALEINLVMAEATDQIIHLTSGLS